MTAQVGELAEQVRGVSYAKAEAASDPRPGYVPILRANNITDDGLVFDDLVYVPKARVSSRQVLRRGDVVIAASSGSLNIVGKAAELRRDFDGAFGAFCKVLRPNPLAVDPAYFAQFFRTQSYRKRISALAAGANINNLKNEHLDKLEIPLPSLDEQRRIATILDQADALCRKRKRALGLLRDLEQSVFLEMFGDPIENSNRLTTASLESVVSSTRKITYGILKPGPDQADGVPYVRVVDIQNGRINVAGLKRTTDAIAHEYRRSTIRRGDLLISIRGHVGRMAVVPQSCDGANITQDTARLAIAAANVEFVKAQLETDSAKHWMDQRTKGAAVKGINLGDLRHFPLIMPARTLQDSFAAKVAVLKKAIESNARQHQYLGQFFSSLQHRAFSGQL